MNKITERQREFLKSLLDARDIPTDADARVDTLWKCLRISEDPEEFGLSTKDASRDIDWLLSLPKKPVAPPVVGPACRQLPPGRYAIENEDGQLRFYQQWVSPDGRRRNLYVMFGPSAAKLFPKTQESICQKILNVGVRECAIRFGREIGACSKCGRTLTDRISRELGIGPICGSHMCEDKAAWKQEVKDARERIKARGDDPDENLANAKKEMEDVLRQMKLAGMEVPVVQ